LTHVKDSSKYAHVRLADSTFHAEALQAALMALFVKICAEDPAAAS
jgi:hypothetical protein